MKARIKQPTPPVLLPTTGFEARPQMGMMCWMATEGGRKCPQCGRYAKQETLGNLSFYTTGSVVARISMYGHLPGYGCNQSRPQNDQVWQKQGEPDAL
jgi:hypothetical protein